MTESFFIYKLEYLFIFSDISFKIPKPNPLYNKKKPCLKYRLIYFICNFITDLFFVWKVLYERSCSTKGAAQNIKIEVLVSCSSCLDKKGFWQIIELKFKDDLVWLDRV